MHNFALWCLILLVIGCGAELSFSSKGAFAGSIIPHLKEKYNRNDITEDSMCRSNFAILVADGLSGVDFNSYFVSTAVTVKVMKVLVKHFPDGFDELVSKNMRATIASYLHDELNNYYEFVKKFIENREAQRGSPVSMKAEDVSAATTWVGTIIENRKQKSYLHVLQRGDSLAGVWRPTAVGTDQLGNKKFVYVPIFKSVEQQVFFNGPFNFVQNSVCFAESISDDIVEIQEGDIVVVGSDGLWDNLNLYVITWALNHMAKTASQLGDFAGMEKGLGNIVKLFEKIPPISNWGVPFKRTDVLAYNYLIPETQQKLEEDMAIDVRANKRMGLCDLKNCKVKKPAAQIQQELFAVPKPLKNPIRRILTGGQKTSNREYFLAQRANQIQNNNFGGNAGVQANPNQAVGTPTSTLSQKFKEAMDFCGSESIFGGDEPFGLKKNLLIQCFTNKMAVFFGFSETELFTAKTIFNSKIWSTVLTKTAEIFSNTEKFFSPFYENARRNGINNDEFFGGKQDDLTAVVELLVPKNSNTNIELNEINQAIESEIKKIDAQFQDHLNSFFGHKGQLI